MTSTIHPELERSRFTASVRRHHRELHVHCYRMLGSFEESEDLVQETFLRAWRMRHTYAGRSSLRAWLARTPKPRGSIRVEIDVDPQSFL